MQKHGKVFADGNKALIAHGFFTAADNHPIAILAGEPHQLVAYRATYQKNIHNTVCELFVETAKNRLTLISHAAYSVEL